MPRIILKSNDSLNYFPNNKPSDFTVKTVNLRNIGHNLEVALNEITFPSGIINVRNGYNEIDVILVKDESGELTFDEIMQMPWIKFKINPRFYNSTSLIDEINSKINKGLMDIGLIENDNQGWITMNRKICIKFGLDIAKILGYNSGEWLTFDPEKMISSNQAGPYKNMSLLNIYCDIVKESLVGENHHQLLRIVNWNFANINGFIFNPSIVYDRPYFIPVKHANTNSIEIKITDSINIPIEFIGDNEPVVIILEFRKV